MIFWKWIKFSLKASSQYNFLTLTLMKISSTFWNDKIVGSKNMHKWNNIHSFQYKQITEYTNENSKKKQTFDAISLNK